jgi:hypothetical protein
MKNVKCKMRKPLTKVLRAVAGFSPSAFRLPPSGGRGFFNFQFLILNSGGWEGGHA